MCIWLFINIFMNLILEMKFYEGNVLFIDLFVVFIIINKNYKIINKKKDREE